MQISSQMLTVGSPNDLQLDWMLISNRLRLAFCLPRRLSTGGVPNRPSCRRPTDNGTFVTRNLSIVPKPRSSLGVSWFLIVLGLLLNNRSNNLFRLLFKFTPIMAARSPTRYVFSHLFHLSSLRPLILFSNLLSCTRTRKSLLASTSSRFSERPGRGTT